MGKTYYIYDVTDGIPEVEVILGDHSAVTLIKPLLTSGTVKVIVTAEDGESGRVYLIKLNDSLLFDMTVGKEFLLGDIDALFAEYSQEDYGDSEWIELCGLFEEAKREVNGYTDLADIEGYDLDALRSDADAIKTAAEKTGNGVKVNLTLTSEISVNFYAPKDGNVLGISINGIAIPARERTINVDGVEYYAYNYTGISPSRAMEAFTVEITYVADGKIFTKTLRYSPIKYAEGVLEAENIEEAGKQLVADVVGFIKAAYEYFGNEEATTEELEYLFDVAQKHPATTPDGIPTPDGVDPTGISSVVYSAQFSLADGVIRLQLNLADTEKPLIVEVGGVAVLSLRENHGQSVVYIDLRAYQLCDTLTLRSGELSGTYSFAKYAEGVMSSDERLDALLLAMYAYSLSALDYHG